jgi:hypothetical protein
MKPSDVVLVVPPLTGTMKKAESEQAAALIIHVCAMLGDKWQPVTFGEIQTAIEAALASGTPTRRERWLRDMVSNPFVRPDVHRLVRDGFAERLSPDGFPLVIRLTQKALGAIESCWVSAGQ